MAVLGWGLVAVALGVVVNTITRKMTMAHVKATGYVRNKFDQMGDCGQGTLEYVGIVLAVVVLVGAVAAMFSGDANDAITIPDKIKAAFTGAIDSLTPGGTE